MSATPVLANHPLLLLGLANGQQRNIAILIKGLGSKSSIIHMDHETRDYRLSLGAKRFQKHYNHFFHLSKRPVACSNPLSTYSIPDYKPPPISITRIIKDLGNEPC
jgi:hypothetical protein